MAEYRLYPSVISAIIRDYIGGAHCRILGLPSTATAADAENYAAREGWISILQDMNPRDYNRLAVHAAAGGHIHMLKWVRSAGVTQWVEAMNVAVRTEQLGAITWIYQTASINMHHVYHTAAVVGKLEIIEHLLKTTSQPQDRSIIHGAMNGAIYGGHIHILEWIMHQPRFPEMIKMINIMNIAARYGKLGIIKWAIRHGGVMNGKVIETAVNHGHLKILQSYPSVIINWDHVIDSSTCHVHILEWICNQHPSINLKYALYNALSNNHINSVKWIISRGVMDLNKALDYASHLECVRLLVENGATDFNLKLSTSSDPEICAYLEQQIALRGF